MPISKNLENKRKTTIDIMEKGNMTIENTTVSQEFAKAMTSERIKKGLWQEPKTTDRERWEKSLNAEN
jgi:hypothetical protein